MNNLTINLIFNYISGLWCTSENVIFSNIHLSEPADSNWLHSVYCYEGYFEVCLHVKFNCLDMPSPRVHVLHQVLFVLLNYIDGMCCYRHLVVERVSWNKDLNCFVFAFGDLNVVCFCCCSDFGSHTFFDCVHLLTVFNRSSWAYVSRNEEKTIRQ